MSISGEFATRSCVLCLTNKESRSRTMLLCIWNLALRLFTRTRTFDQPFPFTLSLDSTVAASTSTMPCTPAQTTRAQQAFTPLILQARFQPESVVQMASSKLPWHQTYPLHVDGIPAGGMVLPPAPTSLPDTQVATPVDPRMKHPKGDTHRSAEKGRGFQLRSLLALPDELYDQMLVSDFK